MRPRWDALVVRGAGLTSRLLPVSVLQELLRLESLEELERRLTQLGFETAREGESLAARLERGVRRWAGSRLRQLAAWSRLDPAPVAIFLRDEDRRSLRRLIRGALAGAPATLRISGTLPTPELPEKVLEELARRSTLAEIATQLTAWGNAFGPPLLALGSAPRPDPLAIELALDRCWGDHGLADGRRIGGEFLRYVEESIDLANASSLIVLVSQRQRDEAARFFLPGGRWLDEATLSELVAAPDLSTLHSFLRTRLAGSSFARALAATGESESRFEEAVLRERIRELSRKGLSEPLGGAPLLRFMLRLRAQVVTLSRAIWERALAVPQASASAPLEAVE